MTSIRFVGSGDAFGSGGRLQTCILVDDDGWRCLVDCGTTSLIGLKAAGINPASIDTIVISHLHGDHFGGLPFLLLDAQLNNRRTTPLLLVGPPDLEARLRATMDVLFPGSQRALEVVDTHFTHLDPTEPPTTVGDGHVEAFEVDHVASEAADEPVHHAVDDRPGAGGGSSPSWGISPTRQRPARSGGRRVGTVGRSRDRLGSSRS